jgi:hypothetical protein
LSLVPLVFVVDRPLMRVVDEAIELEFLVMGSLCVVKVREGGVFGSVNVASVWNVAG